MTTQKICSALLLACCATIAQAHDRWLLPSHSNVSGDQGEWVMVDVSASNEAFSVDKPLGAEQLQITAPDGNSVFPGSSYRGHRKSVVDIHLQQSGTYRLQMQDTGQFWTSYELNGDKKWLRGVSKANRARQLPQGAENVVTSLGYSNVMTFITLNEPTDSFASNGTGVEYVPITHPSDFAQHEVAQLQFIFNGKATAGIEIAITREGTRYRNDPETLTLTSDKNGRIEFTPELAGRYLLSARYRQDSQNHPEADRISGNLFLTFEVILN